MAEIIDDVIHLTQEIGPHPAGTEEEQQAALYLAEELQKEAGFPTIIEDFQCVTNTEAPRLICFIAALVATLLALVLPVAAIPCLIVVIAAAVLHGLEIFGRPTLSRLFRSGASQNVVAKYQPVSATGATRRRKVILVANYDSGKVLREEKAPIAGLLPILQKASAVALAVAAFVLLLRTVFFSGDTGAVSSILSFLLVVCAILFVLPIVRSVLHIAAPYGESANNNASGVSVLLDVARQVGNGLVSNEEIAARGEREGVGIHGEDAAREAGVVPEGARLEYDADLSPQESLAAAKAAIAALTGKPVADKVPVVDISARLVKGGGLDPDEDEAASSVRFEVGETPQRPPREHFPSRTMVSAKDDEPAPADAFVAEEPAAEPEAAAPASEPEPAPGFAPAPQPEQFERTTPVALQPGTTGISERVDRTPAWARAAQEKARANKPAATQPKSVSRSRYADAPAASMGASGVMPVVTATAAAASVAADSASSAAPAEPPSALSSRLAALRDEIAATPAPRISEETKSALDHMADAGTASAASAPAAAVPEPAPEAASVADEPIDAFGAEEPAVEPLPTSAVRSRVNFDRGAAAAEDVPVESTASMSPVAAEPPVEQPAAPSAPVSPHATAAISPIDVSAFLDKEADEVVDDEPQDEAPQARSRFSKRISSSKAAVPVDDDSAATFEGMGDDLVDSDDSAHRAVLDMTNEKTQRVSSEDIQQAIKEASERDVQVPPREDEPEQEAAPASPIINMEQMIPAIPSAPSVDADAEGAEEGSSRQVIVLPDVISTRTSSDEQRQRAPMADANESTQAGTKSLLSNMLPRIDGATAASDGEGVEERDSFGLDLPALGSTGATQSAVSATGSFSTIGGTGSFAPVGDELVADVEPEDRYIDDADDSAYDEDYTETGAFAGTGYVDMPKSRVGRLFGRFRSKKNKYDDEPSVCEWVDVDETYEARSVGKARGDWSSFQQDIDDVPAAAPAQDDGFIDVDYHETSFDNRRDWNGGAFSLSRLRQGKKGKAALEGEDVEEFIDEEPFVEDAAAPRIDGDTDTVEQISRELRKLQDFRHPDIDTEVWFVALGSDMYSHTGMRAFLDEHASEMKGAIVINLEALGAGTLSYLESEGAFKGYKPSSRTKRMLRQASERSGVAYHSAVLPSRETPASLAMAQGIQAFTLAGMGDGNTALYSADNDIVDNIDPEALKDASKLVMALLKSV